ncbi:MAG: molybdate ABC transporter substrate-binding protein [Intestinibacter sp.]
MKKFINFLLVFMLSICVVGCSSNSTSSSSNSSSSDASSTKEAELSLDGKDLKVYCGAGMTKPFEEIANAFKEKTGCNIEVTYANAAQIQTQIKTSEEGDLFVAGAEEELKPVSDYVSESKKLVKHIPVLAVASGNPKDIKGLNDLTKDDVTVVLADAESTPIGKIAKKALGDLKIYKKIKIEATTSTAPELTNAIEADECDAVIVWKENVKSDKVEIVDTTDLDNYIKVVPAASLNCSKNEESLKEFLAYLDTDEVKAIWEKYGYELAPEK